MVLVDFRHNKFDSPPIRVVEDPYMEVLIRAKDHTNIYSEELKSWTSSVAVDISQWRGSYKVGLHPKKGSSSVNLTRTLTVNDAGDYLILIRAIAGPKDKNGKITLTIDGTQIDSQSSYCTWTNWRQYSYGFVHLSSGNHNFIINITKNSFVNRIYLYKMDSYSTESNHGNNRLDINSIEFTNNSVNEVNVATLEVAMNPDWYVPEKNYYSNMVFDYTDHITILLGDDRKTARPMFGGYLSSINPPDDPSLLDIKFMDRLMDLHRKPVYQNFTLATKSKSNENSEWPHINFSNVNELVRYLIKTNEYPINDYRIEYDYGFYLNFGDIDDFNQVICNGFEKVWDQKTGHPPPCLMLKYGKLRLNSCAGIISGAVDAVLFDQATAPFDAAYHSILSFNYQASGISCTYPVEFHVAVTMYREGETPDQAVEYIINFTGKKGESNIIGKVNPVLNGKFQTFKFDLNKAFDKHAPSSAYYVTKIRFKDTYTATQLKDRINSAMWIDNACTYHIEANIKDSIDQGDSYPFDIIQKACEDTNHTAYIDYAMERKDDVMVVAPASNDASDEDIIEGVNVLKVYNKEYNPYDNLKNQAFRHFHPSTKKSSEKTGKSYYENIDSMHRYGPWQEYEDLSDVTKQTDADKNAKTYIENNAYGYWNFSLDLIGTTLINPSDYIVSSIPSHYITGNSPVKAIIHTFKNEESPRWKTQIDVGRESRRFKRLIWKIKQDLLHQSKKDYRTMYNARSIKDIGNTSPGAFIRKVKK